ncbi:hypothetical protein [Halostella salina]|uniref:hypothetical protein n=1 Tax=Halostella salina TaxID=1547897 RepID=UPI0013CEFF02|nr:hypothetical protein [Halostella salina]
MKRRDLLHTVGSASLAAAGMGVAKAESNEIITENVHFVTFSVGLADEYRSQNNITRESSGCSARPDYSYDDYRNRIFVPTGSRPSPSENELVVRTTYNRYHTGREVDLFTRSRPIPIRGSVESIGNEYLGVKISPDVKILKEGARIEVSLDNQSMVLPPNSSNEVMAETENDHILSYDITNHGNIPLLSHSTRELHPVSPADEGQIREMVTINQPSDPDIQWHSNSHAISINEGGT